MVRKIEQAKGLNREQIVDLFSHSHIFSKSDMGQAINHLEEEMEKDEPFETFLAPQELIDVGNLSSIEGEDESEPDRVPGDAFTPRIVEGEMDWFMRTIPSNNISAMSSKGLARERADVDFISKNEDLRNEALRPFDGLLSDSICESARDWNDMKVVRWVVLFL